MVSLARSIYDVGRAFVGRYSPSSSPELEQTAPVVDVDQLKPSVSQGQTRFSPWEHSIFDGGKFSGGFGPTQLQLIDYWTLRRRSIQLFTENPYARGIIRRLVTNEVNTGLTPEASPKEDVIGVAGGSLNEWAESVETRFDLWGKSPQVCDWKRVRTFGEIQRDARMEAIISGDVLVVLRQSRRSKVPAVQLISGGKVQTPLTGSQKLRKGHDIKHGIEIDAIGRHVAFWVRQDNLTFKRMPAFGEKSGRRIAWMVYGTEKLLDDVRGQPLLSLMLQSLKEIDRYRDAVQRKAVINSILAMFIEKTENKAGTLPMTGGAVRRDDAIVTDTDGTRRTFNVASHIPGVVMEELQVGEKPHAFGSEGIDLNFGKFEEAILQTFAWANEVPPEILRLAFSNNYSASQAAINEFKIYLNKFWSSFGQGFAQPIYVDWLISETLQGKVVSSGFLDAWRDPNQHDVFAAWTSTDWYGSIKPSTDMLKQAKGSKLLVDEGWSTNAREARITTGTKFSQNIKRLTEENKQKAEAARPLAEFKQEFGVSVDDVGPAGNTIESTAEAILSLVEDSLEEVINDG